MPDISCPLCNAALVTVRSPKPGRDPHGRPLGWVRPHPEKPNTVLAWCPACQKQWEMGGVRIVIFRAA